VRSTDRLSARTLPLCRWAPMTRRIPPILLRSTDCQERHFVCTHTHIKTQPLQTHARFTFELQRSLAWADPSIIEFFIGTEIDYNGYIINNVIMLLYDKEALIIVCAADTSQSSKQHGKLNTVGHGHEELRIFSCS
jgi:hypothetical protein